jgi:hypothetical protein
MVACNLDLKPAYKVTPAGQERHYTNETFAWYHSKLIETLLYKF